MALISAEVRRVIVVDVRLGIWEDGITEIVDGMACLLKLTDQMIV
jgi:hypothetical protein